MSYSHDKQFALHYMIYATHRRLATVGDIGSEIFRYRFAYDMAMSEKVHNC